jgi:hypothetical protein
VTSLAEVLRELGGVVVATRTWAKSVLSTESGLEPTAHGFSELITLAEQVKDRLEDPTARDLCSRLAAPDPETAELGALSLVAMRPVEAWTDQDCALFESRARALLHDVRQEIVRLKGRPKMKLASDPHELSAHLYNVMANLNVGSSKVMIQATKELLKRLEEESRER